MNRRNFLAAMPLTLATPTLLRNATLGWIPQEPTDEELCARVFERSLSKGLQHEPIGDVVVEVGKTFLGTPYLANALEVPGEERLVVNMRGLDCVSFYENALVIARCVRKGKTTFDDYKKELLFIRYRGGTLDGYTSRLHYTSDYFYDNDKKKVWKDITQEAGGLPFEKTVDFMSTHSDSYRQIKESKEVLAQIVEMERVLNARTRFYIPKENIAKALPFLRNGDILGFTTNMTGLDTSHTGILVKERGETHVLNAPLAGKQVVMSDGSLAEYLERNAKMTGLIAARPLEP